MEPIQPRLYGTDACPGEKIVHIADTSASIIAEWKETPDDGLRPACCDRDLVYNDSVITDGERMGEPLSLYMDVYYDTGSEEARPAVLVIPGGAYMMCRRTLYARTIARLVREGFVVAIMEYHVIGQGLIGDAVADVRTAMTYLRTNADRWHIRPDKIALLGGSAGGHLTALAAVTTGKASCGTADVPAPFAAVDMYGISDMTRIAEDYGDAMVARHQLPASAESQFVFGCLSGKSIVSDPAVAAQADPVTFVDGTEPPFLLLHGDADIMVSPSATVRMHDALRAHGVKSTRYSIVGAPHGGPIFESRDALDTIVRFLKEQL